MKTIRYLIFLFVLNLWIPVSAFGQIPDSFFDWRSDSGLFSTVRQDGKYFWNIPDSLIGRDFSLFVSILNGPLKERTPYEKQGYAGDRYGPRILRFGYEGNDIVLYQIMGYIMPADDRRHELFSERESHIVLHRFPVIGRQDNACKIDVTEFLADDFLFGLGAYGFQMGIGASDKVSTPLVYGRDDALLIRSERVYTPQFPRGQKTRWRLGACLQLLPESQTPVRLASPLMGYFSLPFSDVSMAGTRTVDVICRWRLGVRERDRQAYKSGQTVIPEHQIRFALSPDFPPLLRPVVRQSVVSWNRVFESVGYRDAIVLYEPDTAMYDDSRLSWIVLKPSPVPNAYGKSFADPRTGEILSSHVSIFQGISGLLQRWFTTQTGLLRDMTDAEASRLLRLVVEHELGHVLGLAHNFYGSTLLTTSQLRDPEIAESQPFGSSIMDYMRLNYAAQPSDSIDFFHRIATIGSYDTCAIYWGYRYIGRTPEEEKVILDRYLDTLQGHRCYRFLKGDTRNPETLDEDLGYDNLQAAALGMNYLKQIVHPVTSADSAWCAMNTVLLREGIQGKFQSYLFQALAYVGGYRCIDEGWPNHREPIGKDEQRAALSFIRKYYVDNEIEVPVELLQGMTTEIVPALVERLFTLASTSGYDVPGYDAEAYLNDLTDLFVAGRTQTFTWWRIYLCRVYLKELYKAGKRIRTECPSLLAAMKSAQKEMHHIDHRIGRRLNCDLFHDIDTLAYEH